MHTKLFIAAPLTALLILGGCASAPTQEQPAATATSQTTSNNNDYYQVEHEGRVYVFDDRDTFRDFVAHWETPYRKVRIGAGPDGMTLVFGLTNEDKSKSEGIASMDLYDGKLQGAEDFYAEVWSEGRIYVFSSWADLQDFRATGEANLRYTDIGAGPDGRTVVYVLNDSTKKNKPVALMQTFKSVHSL